MPEDAAGPRGFQTTNWRDVRRAADADPDLRREALGRLLQLYEPALQAHLVSRFRLELHQAEDLLQDFIRDKVLTEGALAGADPARGKLRTYLLEMLRNYALSAFRRDAARKRAPLRALSLEDEPGVEGADADAFDVAWALRVLGESVRRMRARCAAEAREDLWAVFTGRTLALLEGAAPVPYEELAVPFGFASPVQASNALTTARRKFGAILREVIGEYADEEQVDEEIDDLKRALRAAGAEVLEALRTSLWRPTPEVSLSTGQSRASDTRLLARLMQLGARGRRDLQPEELAEALSHQLAAPVRFDLGGFDADLARPVHGAVRGTGLPLSTFADLLHHAAPPLALLELTRHFAKDQREAPDASLSPEVATVLYYAAILVARLRHGERISHLDEAALSRGAAWAVAQTWVDERTRGLFRDGLRHLGESE
jgi:DNA-directed RNA polymerase specialized sigma24 family protein